MIHEPCVGTSLKHELLQGLELGMGGVCGEAEDDALRGRENGSHVPESLEREDPVSLAPGRAAVHHHVDFKVPLQQIQGGVVDAGVSLDPTEYNGLGLRSPFLHLLHQVREDHGKAGLGVGGQVELPDFQLLNCGTQTLARFLKYKKNILLLIL